jgi:hypothetical protein
MPVNLASIEALVALITIIAFLVSVGKWIQMREAIAQRVIDVDTQLKEINEWREQHLRDADSLYVRKENCGLHMLNLDVKLQKLTDSITELKRVLEKHIEENGRRR